MLYKFCAVVATLCLSLLTLVSAFYFLSPSEEDFYDYGYLGHCEMDSVVVIPLHGDVMWGYMEDSDYLNFSGSEVVNILREINDSDWYSGVILDIDSSGGMPVASFRLAEAVGELALPTVAVVDDMALSGAYAIAVAADQVIAHPISDVGSIGVTMSYVNESKANANEGYIYESLATGAFKDTGNPAKELSSEERLFIEANLQNAHNYFVDYVAKARGLDVDQVKALADGKWYSGTSALELGLVDTIGGFKEGLEYIKVENDGRDLPVCYVTL